MPGAGIALARLVRDPRLLMACSSMWTISTSTSLGRKPPARRFSPTSNRGHRGDDIAREDFEGYRWFFFQKGAR